MVSIAKIDHYVAVQFYAKVFQAVNFYIVAVYAEIHANFLVHVVIVINFSSHSTLQ